MIFDLTGCRNLFLKNFIKIDFLIKIEFLLLHLFIRMVFSLL